MSAARFFSVLLQIVGALVLVGVLAMVVAVYLQATGKSRAFDNKELSFVLAGAGAELTQAWSIIQSAKGPRTFTGDHFDYACIQLSKAPRLGQWWKVEPESEPLIMDALDFSIDTAISEGARCFPSKERINTAEISRRLLRLVLHDRLPTAVEVIFYEPSLNRLYYTSEKT